MKRLQQNAVIAAVNAAGLALIALASGFVYADMRRFAWARERMKLEYLNDPTMAGETGLWAAAESYDDMTLLLPAFASGLLGAGLLAFGGTLLLTRLPWFRRRAA